MSRKAQENCKRPYTLGKRLELSDWNRAKVLGAARAQLESQGFVSFTLDGLARESCITRQTIHNLFGTKADVLEALFDQIALDSGMERMRFVMMQSDPRAMLTGFVEVFTSFWSRNRMLLRRIHGIAAIDPELGSAVEARNRRRRGAAARVVEALGKGVGEQDAAEKRTALYALTSFEFYDALADSCGNESKAAQMVRTIVESAVL